LNKIKKIKMQNKGLGKFLTFFAVLKKFLKDSIYAFYFIRRF